MSKRLIGKHQLVINGRSTSVSLEDAFWEELKALSAKEGLSVSALATRIANSAGTGNLSSALRVYVLNSCRSALKPADLLQAPSEASRALPGSVGDT